MSFTRRTVVSDSLKLSSNVMMSRVSHVSKRSKRPVSPEFERFQLAIAHTYIFFHTWPYRSPRSWVASANIGFLRNTITARTSKIFLDLIARLQGWVITGCRSGERRSPNTPLRRPSLVCYPGLCLDFSCIKNLIYMNY